MDLYSVDEAFEKLKEYRITTHKESVRRWLRQGVIKGIAPSSRKEGWLIPKENLADFVRERLPNALETKVIKESNERYTTDVVKEIEEQARAAMWIEVVNKNIWEGYVEIKRSRIHDCILHRRYPTELEHAVWERCVTNSRAYKKPRVSYLLEAFGFEQQRLLLDQNLEDIEEQVIFAIIEYVRQSRMKNTR
jgi:hypothetical protein